MSIFFQALGVALIWSLVGIVIARYSGESSRYKLPPLMFGGWRLIASVVIVALLSVVLFNSLAALLGVPSQYIGAIGDFLAPLGCSVYYARRKLIAAGFTA